MRQTLAEFTEANPVLEKMLWKAGFPRQMDTLRRVLELGQMYDSKAAVSIVSYHTSKSIKLPVALFEVPIAGLEVFMRDNFYNWAISVKADRPLNADFPRPLMLEPGCFEGFDRGDLPIYAAWKPDARRFSGHIWSGDSGLLVVLTRLLDTLAEIRER